jgi:N-acetylneuraminic acid mutarotase
MYGAMGVAAATNVPGARDSAVSWIDQSGNLWLFAGYGLASSKTPGNLNDLWELNPTTDEWTWVNGSNTTGAPSVYGTLGVTAATNVPGARWGSVSWTDNNGNFWLFGGSSVDPSATPLELTNDLWEFSPATKEWTWVSGSSAVGAQSVYGTQGVAAATNAPGGRYGSTGWVDPNGNLWLFGGVGMEGPEGDFNDLWKFNTASNEWTWVSGGNTLNASGVYGTQGVAAAANVPGARHGAVSWTDSNGYLWLFGGNGPPSGSPNDLWKFNPTSSEWTWINGSEPGLDYGIYGTQGVPAASNVPGGRENAVSWIGSDGHLWLFGGVGWDAQVAEGDLNDLWRYQP